MTPAIRNRLPPLVAAAWIAGTWYALGAPSAREIWEGPFLPDLWQRYSGIEAVGWLAMMLAAMVVADRLLCRFGAWRWGVDPAKVHWSRLRNRDGLFLCAQCGSPFMLPPEDGRDESFVHCGDCGHAVAPYGEMKPYFPEILAASGQGFANRLPG